MSSEPAFILTQHLAANAVRRPGRPLIRYWQHDCGVLTVLIPLQGLLSSQKASCLPSAQGQHPRLSVSG